MQISLTRNRPQQSETDLTALHAAPATSNDSSETLTHHQATLLRAALRLGGSRFNDKAARVFPDRQAWSHRVAAGHPRQHRSVCNAQASDSIHP